MKNKKSVSISILILTSLMFIYPMNLFAEKKIPTAEEFLSMPLDKAFPVIAQLNKEEAKILITQIRSQAREKNPDVDKLYFLTSHLEEIQAVEKEQARLVSLIWVYALGFLLFTGFLAYILISQRKAIREFRRNAK